MRDKLRKTLLVFGGADYKDFLGHLHSLEYCYQMYWDNRTIKFGFHLVPCLPPNNIHNCTDEDCKDWKPAN